MWVRTLRRLVIPGALAAAVALPAVSAAVAQGAGAAGPRGSRTSEVFGVVRDASGEPLAGAEIAVVAGVSLGLVAGYFGGLVDDLIARVLDVVFAFPTILLALGIVGMLGPSLTNTMIAIGIVYTPAYARLARGVTLAVKERDFVEAAIVSGANSARVIGRHILPNVAAPLIVQTSLRMATAILTASGLSFLGLGPPPPEPEWGAMLSTARKFITSHAELATYPGLAILLVTLGFNLLGDGLRDALDPRLRR